MKIIKVEDRNRKLIEILLNIWEDSVRATHLFLASKDIDKIKEYVPQALENVEKLVVLENDASELVAFMGVQDKKIEMLFIKNSERGKGLGKQLIIYGIKNYG
ncbi:MAG: GNAT family N-acetyltransferase, partial [Mycoplasmatota bacterium]|nr:GNAT family N-acetyltransferase [Mycoplasmatota bacterium]